jgi:hypothetical protein
MTRKEYVTVKDMPKYYPFLTVGALRHLIFENRNGIHECLLRVGRKIFFDIEKFQDWMDRQKMETNK